MNLIQLIAEREHKFSRDLAAGSLNKRFRRKRLTPIAKDLIGFVDAGATVQAVDAKAVSARFVMSTEEKDREGDVIIQRGIRLDNFLANPVCLWDHNLDGSSPPIGTWRNVQIGDSRTTGEWFPDQGDADAMWVFGKVERGIIRGCSIGILPLVGKRRGDGFLIEECDLAECSICPVPMNAAALRLSASDKVSPWLKNVLESLPKSASVVGGWSGKSWAERQKAMSEGTGSDGGFTVPPEHKDLQDCVSRKVKILIGEGYAQDQALAIAYHMCGEEKAAGYKKSLGEIDMTGEDLKTALADNNKAMLDHLKSVIEPLAKSVEAIKLKAEKMGEEEENEPKEGKPGHEYLLALKAVHDEHADKQDSPHMEKLSMGLRKLAHKAEEAYGTDAGWGKEREERGELEKAEEGEGDSAEKKKENEDTAAAQQKSLEALRQSQMATKKTLETLGYTF